MFVHGNQWEKRATIRAINKSRPEEERKSWMRHARSAFEEDLFAMYSLTKRPV